MSKGAPSVPSTKYQVLNLGYLSNDYVLGGGIGWGWSGEPINMGGLDSICGGVGGGQPSPEGVGWGGSTALVLGFRF